MGLHNLKTLAFEAIRSRLSEANILDETFSRFTARFVGLSSNAFGLVQC